MTPEDIAREFSNWSSGMQAQFFNAVAENAKKWSYPFDLQAISIGNESALTDDGRRIMKAIGEFSAK